MKKVMTAAFVLCALALAATATTAQAEKQTAIPSRAVSAVLVYCTWGGLWRSLLRELARLARALGSFYRTPGTTTINCWPRAAAPSSVRRA